MPRAVRRYVLAKVNDVSNSHELERRLCLLDGVRAYPTDVPYGPAERYPEFAECAWADKTEAHNEVYAAVRNVLFGMGLDEDRYGTRAWNPLGDLVARAGHVTIKPNMVRHWNENPLDSWQTVVTHWSVLRPLIDYAILAVGQEGRVIVGDAPQWDCDMRQLEQQIGVDSFRKHYASSGCNVSFVDFRPEYHLRAGLAKSQPRPLPGDPEGYVLVDLGGESEFSDQKLNPRRYYGSGYDNRTTIRAHSAGRHQYLISRSVLTSDLFINVPKLKTHHLLGITAAMKNLVGINGDKNYLPHFRVGFPGQGGDQYPAPTWDLLLRYWALRLALPLMARSMLLTRVVGGCLAMFHHVGGRNPYAGGAWIGNDTVWRMTLDLNRILLFADRDGTMSHDRHCRRYLTVVDGIVGGEGEGPMSPGARNSGLLLAAGNPLLCDIAAAHVMGFDVNRLKLIREGMKDHSFSLLPCDVQQVDLRRWTQGLSAIWESIKWTDLPCCEFAPPTGWETLPTRLAPRAAS